MDKCGSNLILNYLFFYEQLYTIYSNFKSCAILFQAINVL